jgi:hypothetical protein
VTWESTLTPSATARGGRIPSQIAAKEVRCAPVAVADDMGVEIFSACQSYLTLALIDEIKELTGTGYDHPTVSSISCWNAN